VATAGDLSIKGEDAAARAEGHLGNFKFAGIPTGLFLALKTALQACIEILISSNSTGLQQVAVVGPELPIPGLPPLQR
jgi:hypothetical protein